MRNGLIKSFENEQQGIRVELIRRKDHYVVVLKEAFDGKYEITSTTKASKNCRIEASKAFDRLIKELEEDGITFPNEGMKIHQ